MTFADETDDEKRRGAAEPGNSPPFELPEVYRVLLDNMSEGVSLCQEDGTLVYTNPAEDRLFGYGAGELVGQHVSIQNDLPPEENQRRVGEVIDALKRTGIWTGEWRNRRKDGSSFRTSCRITAVELNGRGYWLCVQEDASTGRAAEAALAESQARLELATSAAGLGIWDWDLQTNSFVYSPRAREICGLPSEGEITYDMVRAVTHPDDYPRTSEQARRSVDPAIKSKEAYEYRVLRPDGQVRWVVAHGKAQFEVRNGVEQAVRYVGTIQDVTDHRVLEEQQRELGQRLRLALEASRMAVYEADLVNGTIVGSPDLCRLYGLPEDCNPDIATLRSHCCPGERERVAELMTRAQARGEPYLDTEFRIVRADGEVRWLGIRARLFSSQEGKHCRAVGVITDVTERKAAELRHAVLADLTGRIRDLDDPDEISYVAAEVLGRALGVSRAGYGTIDKAAETITIAQDWNAPGITTLAGVLRFRDYGSYIEDLKRGETVVFADAEKDPRTSATADALKAISAQAVVNMPVTEQGGFVALLYLNHKEARTWTPQELDLIREVAEHTRTAVERRRAERDLRALTAELEQRVDAALAERGLLADLVENTDAFVQVADLNFRWLAINRASADEFERILGVRPKVGDSMLDALAHMPEHQEAVRAVWGRALAGEEFTEVGEFGDPGRDRRNYEMKYHVLRDAKGERVGAYQFVYDVTERVREQRRLAEAEAARREADALYRAYFQNSPEALFVIGVGSGDGFVVEQVNPAHEAALGFKLEDVRGKRIEEILPPDVAEQVLATYRHVVETGAILQYREVFDLTGDPQHWDTSLVPVRDAEGRITRLIGSGRNVTRQVVAEEALRQSQKMEAMGQLTGGVAHDFNNLLTPIIGSLDMLQRNGVGGEREQRLVAGAMQSAERAKTLVQRLLAFARRQPLQPVPVDIARLVRGLGDLVGSTTGPQVKVIIEAADHLPPAMADPNQLEMAILNLAVNARDAMSEAGTLRISANAERVGPGHPSGLRAGRYIRLSVADTGSGMDEATLARAVEPFFSTKGIGKGTGLGLSMVHGLASQLGGALTIHSRLGLGTNVELWLPESAAEPLVADPVSEPASTALAHGTALLVDDEELVRFSTADMLNDLGYHVIEAASAEDAMRLIEKGEPFDVLVTDHLMPGMTGTDLARAVQAAKPGVPILLVSGYAESEGIAADLPRLTKPFRKDELASSLLHLSTST